MHSSARSVLTPIIAGIIALTAISYTAIGQVTPVGPPTPIDDSQCTAARCRKCLGGCGPVAGTIKIRCGTNTDIACCCAATGTLPTAGLCGCHSASYCQQPPSGTQCQ